MTQLKKFTDPVTSQAYLLASDALYGGNTMDGKIKVLSISDIFSQEGAGESLIKEKFYVEVPYGVQTVEHVAMSATGGFQEYFLAGLDDGTVQIFDYTKNKEKQSIQRPVFKVQKTVDGAAESRPADIDHPYDYFQESLYEHGSSVTAIEKNFKDNTLFASSGRDQNVFIWKLSGEQGHDDVEFVSEIGKQ